MIDGKKRFIKGDEDNYINVNNGIFLAGVADSEYNEGSLFFVRKKFGEEFNILRLDSGTTYGANYNSSGTFVVDSNTIPSGRHWYCWSLQLA
jgi:hypothetical protein